MKRLIFSIYLLAGIGCIDDKHPKTPEANNETQSYTDGDTNSDSDTDGDSDGETDTIQPSCMAKADI